MIASVVSQMDSYYYYKGYYVHWKNSDNSKYGAVKGFDENYNLIGEAETTYFQRRSMLTDFINRGLPSVRATSIDTDQYIIDDIASRLGMKKDDVSAMINDKNLWRPENSSLPAGFSYDTGAYYLKDTALAKPYGYNEFTFDKKDFYTATPGTSATIDNDYSEPSDSQNHSGHKFTPPKKYDVVKYDGKQFTTVSKESVTAHAPYFLFFRPGNLYAFGYEQGLSSTTAYSRNNSGYPLPIPGFSSISDGSDGITLKWNSVKGAEKYRVYVKGDTDWEKIGDTTGTSFVYDKAKSGKPLRPSAPYKWFKRFCEHEH